MVQHRPGREPIVEIDEEMERRYSQTMDVIHVLDSLGSWRGDTMIIDTPTLPNG